MKKLFLLWAVALAFVACSKEDDHETTGIKLNENSVTLHSMDEFTIECTGTNLKFQSLDPYVAQVDETGKVTALLIGETDIEATASEGRAKLHVMVDPLYDLYEEPYMNWGASMNDVKAVCGIPYGSTEDTFAYQFNDIHIMTMYSFESGKLAGALVAIDAAHVTDLMHFLLERYIAVSESGGTYFFMDRNKKIAIGMQKMSGHNAYQVIYMPYDKQNMSTHPFATQEWMDLPRK